jgi:ribonucleoside-triphosphate reductase
VVAKARYVKEYFALNADNLKKIHRLKPNFGYDGFGEIVFYRTYSRLKIDGSQESWHDVVIRVINGTMSIRKDWYLKNYIEWNEDYWQQYALGMAIAMFKMYWLPAGRGMWQMGTEFVYERGAMSLNNCGFTKLGGNQTLSNDLNWLMDALMLGVGVGFEAVRDNLQIYKPQGTFDHFILDSREGWCNAWSLEIDAHTKPGCRLPIFHDDYVRKKGQPIKGFGGLSSGPEPLMHLLRETRKLFQTPGIDVVRLKNDLANQGGCCVVAGNVRRSAELSKGKVTDPIFLNLKDYELNPEREDWGYMSNNSVALWADTDFDMLGEVARRVVVRGEPGIMNLRNFKIGRVGKHFIGREDKADGLNPCGEIPLEDKELCNVVETLPTRCPNVETWYKACEYAALYAQSVSLLPTHREETNRVVVRNRRIGVGIIDWTGWVHDCGMHKVTSYMRKGYDTVVRVATERASESGVPAPIRFTTIKPGGTGPKLPGKTSGIGYPTFVETLRRMRVAANNPICPVLDAAGVPYEPDYFDPDNTRVYCYPTKQGPARPADQVSLWEQAMNLVTVQREWSDNAVSNTLYFKPRWKLVLFRDSSDPKLKGMDTEETHNKAFREQFPEYVSSIWANKYTELFAVPEAFKHEDDKDKIVVKKNKYGVWELSVYEFDPNHEEDDIERVLSAITPLIKSCSLLPHSAKGAYRQMPEEGITPQEYETRLKAIKPINWSKFGGSDGIDERYCQGDACVIPQNGSNS